MTARQTVFATAAFAVLAAPAMAATLGSNSVVYALGGEGRTLVTLAAPGLSMPAGIALDFGGRRFRWMPSLGAPRHASFTAMTTKATRCSCSIP